jgi:hypothetical protein
MRLRIIQGTKLVNKQMVLHLINVSIYLSINQSIHPWLYITCEHWPLFQFLNPCTGDQPAAKQLTTHSAAQAENKRTQTSMSRVGFEPITPVFKWEKTVHALDRAATMIDN